MKKEFYSTNINSVFSWFTHIIKEKQGRSCFQLCCGWTVLGYVKVLWSFQIAIFVPIAASTLTNSLIPINTLTSKRSIIPIKELLILGLMQKLSSKLSAQIKSFIHLQNSYISLTKKIKINKNLLFCPAAVMIKFRMIRKCLVCGVQGWEHCQTQKICLTNEGRLRKGWTCQPQVRWFSRGQRT